MMIGTRQTGASALVALWALSAAAATPAGPATGLDRDAMNPAIRPQDDLFGAMNGKWLDQTPIPPDKAEYGVFNQLRDKSDQRIKGLIEELAASPLAGETALGKAAAFYRAYMDTDTIDHLGTRSLEAWLRQIDAVEDRGQIAQWVGRAQGAFHAPFALGIRSEEHTSELQS